MPRSDSKAGHDLRPIRRPSNGLLGFGNQKLATWLPLDWEIDCFPLGWSNKQLAAWFKYALNVAKDTTQRPDARPTYLPTPQMLRHHAYLIAFHLGKTPPMEESRLPDTLDASLAAIHDIGRMLMTSSTGVAAGQRTPDTKPDKSWRKTPHSNDLRRLITLLNHKNNENRAGIDVAREFAEHDEKKAQSLLRQSRRYRHLLAPHRKRTK